MCWPRLVEDIKPVTGELPVQFTVEDLRNLNLNADNTQPRHLVITMTRTNNPDAHDYNIEIEVHNYITQEHPTRRIYRCSVCGRRFMTRVL